MGNIDLQVSLCCYFPGGTPGLHLIFEITIFKEIRVNILRSIHMNSYSKYLIQKHVELFLKISSFWIENQPKEPSLKGKDWEK